MGSDDGSDARSRRTRRYSLKREGRRRRCQTEIASRFLDISAPYPSIRDSTCSVTAPIHHLEHACGVVGGALQTVTGDSPIGNNSFRPLEISDEGPPICGEHIKSAAMGIEGEECMQIAGGRTEGTEECALLDEIESLHDDASVTGGVYLELDSDLCNVHEDICDCTEEGTGNAPSPADDPPWPQYSTTDRAVEDGSPSPLTAQRAELIVRWQSLFAVQLTCGSVRMTVDQYETVRRAMNWQSEGLPLPHRKMPSAKTVQRSIIPFIRDFSYAKSNLKSFPVDLRKPGARGSSSAAGRSTSLVNGSPIFPCQTSSVRIVSPSEWALLDVQTGPTHELMFGTRKIYNPWMLKNVFETIEDAPIVQNRMEFIDADNQICVNQAPTSDCDAIRRLPVPVSSGSSILVEFFLSIEEYEFFKEQDIFQGRYAREKSLTGIVGDIVRTGCNEGNAEVPVRGGDGAACQVILSTTAPSGNRYGYMFSGYVFRPGDTIVELDVSKDASLRVSNLCFVLVFRMCRTLPGEPAVTLLVAARNSDNTNSACSKLTWCSARVHNVCTSNIEGDTNPRLSKAYSPSSGYLADGRRYFVYRVMLYTDDFQPHVSRKGSFGGCYMLPLGVSPAERSSYGSVRCIALTPPGISTNMVLQSIIPDIVEGAVHGFEGRDPFGNVVTVFLDVVGYIGDYPAVTHTLDVLGHTARAPCHLCSFLRDDRSGEESAKHYGHTTRIHSRVPSFTRSGARMQNVRDGDAGAAALKEVGLRADSEGHVLPFHELSNALFIAREKVPLTRNGQAVVPAVFDPYRSCMVAPDHLLFGLGQDVIKAAIVTCPRPVRAAAEMFIIDALRRSNLVKQNRLFKESPPSLLPMTMSDLFAVLLVAPVAFRCAANIIPEGRGACSSTSQSPKRRKRSGKMASRVRAKDTDDARDLQDHVLALLSMFQILVASTLYWPDSRIDGLKVVVEFNMDEGKDRLDMLFSMACDYVDEVHKTCIASPHLAGPILNKPNLHRLIELYAHTLPAFGHISHFQELLFETAHQPLKRGILRSNNRDPQLAAMTAALANDWEYRLSIEVERGGNPENWSHDTAQRIKHVLLGRDFAGRIPSECVRAAFSSPVLLELEKNRRHASHSTHRDLVWRIEHEGQNIERDSFYIIRALTSTEERSIQNATRCFTECGYDSIQKVMSVQTGTSASAWRAGPRGSSAPSLQRRGSIGRLRRGAVVQALVRSAVDCKSKSEEHCLKLLVGMDSVCEEDTTVHGSGRESHWLIIDLFNARVLASGHTGDATDLSYAVVLPCADIHSRNIDFPCKKVEPGSTPSILPLDASVREVLCCHCCKEDECSIDWGSETVRHGGSISSGTAFYVLGRQQGYPPRIS